MIGRSYHPLMIAKDRLLCLFLVGLLCSGVLAQEKIQKNNTVKPGQFIGAKASVMPDWFKESFLEFEDDIAEAAEQGKRLMLYFHQQGCPYCNALIEDNFTQPDIKQAVQENLDVVAINIFGDRDVVHVGGNDFTEKTLAEALKVQYTPTLIFFNEQREVALRLDGYYPPEQFRHALAYVAEHKDGEMSYTEYLANVALPVETGELREEPFFMQSPLNLTRIDQPAQRPLAVFFESKQCTACDVLHENTLADPPTRELVEQFDNVQLDMWGDTELVTPTGEIITARQWAEKLGIKFAPSIVLFDKAGQEVMRTDAFLKTFHLQSLFDYVLSESYKTEPNFQRFISARSEHIREQGQDVDIWNY